ncbi:MAG: hypothetical protein WC509_04520 [Candidatus Izemoplasmatales bacterium]
MQFDEWLGVIGIMVGLIGIVVGIIGGRSLSISRSMNNTIRNPKNSTVQQAQTINIGLDSYAVIKLSKETTQEELQSIISSLASNEKKLGDIEQQIMNTPTTTVSKEAPKNPKNGDVWIQIKEDENKD